LLQRLDLLRERRGLLELALRFMVDGREIGRHPRALLVASPRSAFCSPVPDPLAAFLRGGNDRQSFPAASSSGVRCRRDGRDGNGPVGATHASPLLGLSTAGPVA